MKVLVRHTYVVRLAPIAMRVACPPLLYRIGSFLWGPVPGALAAVAYVVLPIALAFGNFPGFEGPLVFGCLVTTWGYLRFQDRWQRRWMVVSLLGVVWSVNCDWEACIFLGAVLGTLLVTGLFANRWFARVNARRFGQWWSLTVIITVMTVLAYVVYVKRVGNVDEFLNQEAKREKGNDASIWAVLASRRYWIDISFTPLAIAIGKIAVPIFLFRFFVLRRHLERSFRWRSSSWRPSSTCGSRTAPTSTSTGPCRSPRTGRSRSGSSARRRSTWPGSRSRASTSSTSMLRFRGTP